MKYISATKENTKEIYDLVQHTIKTIYPKYYPAEVVDNVMVGTGSFMDNHITRVYVAPEHQGKGYGTFLVKALEGDGEGSIVIK